MEQKHKAIGCKLTSLMDDAFTFFFFGSGGVLIGSSDVIEVQDNRLVCRGRKRTLVMAL